MSFFKSAVAVGANTLLSRIVGFFRDILVAHYLGATSLADIWVAAFRFPNLFRRIIAEGAFSSAYIPIYGRILKENGEKEAEEFTANILSIVGAWVFGGIILLQILMPYLVYLFTPGYSEAFTAWGHDFFMALFSGHNLPAFPTMTSNDKISLTVSMTIICLPYAGFMFLMAHMSGLLNYHGHFAAPAFVPVLINIILSLTLLLSPILGYEPLWGLGYGVFISGVVQVLWLYYLLRKNNLEIRFGALKVTEHVRSFKKLFIPGLISGGVTQINILAGSMIASFEAGAMSYLYYADRVYQMPLGLVGATLGVVLLPVLVKKIEEANIVSARDLLARSLEFAVFLTLPAALTLLVASHDITTLLFEGGKFTALDSAKTALALTIYGFGLPAFILIKLYSPGYYASHDTHTPMVYATISIAINVILGFGLFPFIGFYAVPVATVISSWQNAFCLYWGLRKRDLVMFDKIIITRLFKILLSCLGMTGFIVLFQKEILPLFPNSSHLLVSLMLTMALVVYLLLAHLLVIFPKGSIKQYLRRSEKKV